MTWILFDDVDRNDVKPTRVGCRGECENASPYRLTVGPHGGGQLHGSIRTQRINVAGLAGRTRRIVI
jgi:hypothetical protein